LFGSRTILAKIINNKLVIRVGGGFTNADDFIAQYGPTEVAKLAVLEGRNEEGWGDAGSEKGK
jgi:hypothetical protein